MKKKPLFITITLSVVAVGLVSFSATNGRLSIADNEPEENSVTFTASDLSAYTTTPAHVDTAYEWHFALSKDNVTYDHQSFETDGDLTNYIYTSTNSGVSFNTDGLIFKITEDSNYGYECYFNISFTVQNVTGIYEASAIIVEDGEELVNPVDFIIDSSDDSNAYLWFGCAYAPNQTFGVKSITISWLC